MDFNWDKFPAHDFEEARKFARAFYRAIGGISCPALGNETILFSRVGLKHLLYKPSRTRQEIIMRLSFLQHVYTIIADPSIHIEFRQNPEADYWGLEKRINRSYLTIVIRQIGTRHKHFYSIMGYEL